MPNIIAQRIDATGLSVTTRAGTLSLAPSQILATFAIQPGTGQQKKDNASAAICSQLANAIGHDPALILLEFDDVTGVPTRFELHHGALPGPG